MRAVKDKISFCRTNANADVDAKSWAINGSFVHYFAVPPECSSVAKHLQTFMPIFFTSDKPIEATTPEYEVFNYFLC